MLKRMTKELCLVEENELSTNRYVYRFEDKEGTKYEWFTRQQRYFRKEVYWRLSFIEGVLTKGYVLIRDVRYTKGRSA